VSQLETADRQRFRRSSHLVAFWGPGGMRVRNFARGRELLVFGRSCEVLGAFSQWRTVTEGLRYCPGMTFDAFERQVGELHAAEFLVEQSDEANQADAAMDTLRDWNPAAGFFHSTTRNASFVGLGELRAIQQARARHQPWPGAVFTPVSSEQTALDLGDTTGALSRILSERRSWRQFGPGALSLDSLGSLLWQTGGIQQWVFTDLGTFALKTSPSGGSLHPIELYVLARSVEGVAPGFLHYSGADHRLRRLTSDHAPPAITRFLPAQPWFEGANAVIFFVAHYERSLWRYTYARAYRAPLVEAGHLAQTFCLHATELGLAPFVSMALADEAIEREISADGITRAVLYAAGVGSRPDSTTATSAAIPAGHAAPRVEPNRPAERHRGGSPS
jgi:SagB-type dehydrogenase family enzyme